MVSAAGPWSFSPPSPTLSETAIGPLTSPSGPLSPAILCGTVTPRNLFSSKCRTCLQPTVTPSPTLTSSHLMAGITTTTRWARSCCTGVLAGPLRSTCASGSAGAAGRPPPRARAAWRPRTATTWSPWTCATATWAKPNLASPCKSETSVRAGCASTRPTRGAKSP